MTTLIKTTQEIKSVLSESRRPVGFVPTMGALHAGHVSLISAAKRECKTTVVSVFVNPLQFGPNEDYEDYPRDLDNDLKICERNEVDFVFAPTQDEIYPANTLMQKPIKSPLELTKILCGRTRPTHFEGVATVVYKLCNIVQSDHMYFGKKDLQQLYVVRWLAQEYNLPVVIKSCPIVREENGLACSSRNRYLSREEKDIAANLYKSLLLAKQNTKSGLFSVNEAILESIVFLSQFSQLRVEYFDARDKENLSEVKGDRTGDFYYLVAAKIGKVRLIDNVEVI